MIIQMLGPMLLVLPVLGIGALVVALVLTGLAAARFRAPAFLWLAGPLLLIAVGWAEAVRSGSRVDAALVHVDWADVSMLARGAWGEMLAVPCTSTGLAGVIALLSAGLLAIGSTIGARSVVGQVSPPVGPDGQAIGAAEGPERASRLTLLSAVPTLLATAVGPLLALGLGAGFAGVDTLLHGGLPLTLAIAGASLVSGLACTVVAIRIGTAPADAARGVGSRATVAVLGLLGVGCVVVASREYAEMGGLMGMAMVDPAQHAVLVANAVALWVLATWTGWGAALGSLLPPIALLIPVSSHAGPPGRMLLGLVGSLGLLLACGGVVLMAISMDADVVDRATSRRAIVAASGVRGVPEPRPELEGEPAFGDCVLTASEHGFTPHETGPGGCTDGKGPDQPPIIVVSADDPASRLTQNDWYPETGEIRLVLRRPNPFAVATPEFATATFWSTLPLVWRKSAGVSTDPAVPGAVAIVAPDGHIALVEANGNRLPLVDPKSGVATLQQALAGSAVVYVVPPGGWTVGQLLDWCAAVAEAAPTAQCGLAPAP